MKNIPFIEGNVIYLDRFKAYKQETAESDALRKVMVEKLIEIQNGMDALAQYKQAIRQFNMLHNELAVQIQEISKETELLNNIHEENTGEDFLKAVQNGKYKDLFPEEEDDEFDDFFPS